MLKQTIKTVSNTYVWVICILALAVGLSEVVNMDVWGILFLLCLGFSIATYSKSSK